MKADLHLFYSLVVSPSDGLHLSAYSCGPEQLSRITLLGRGYKLLVCQCLLRRSDHIKNRCYYAMGYSVPNVKQLLT